MSDTDSAEPASPGRGILIARLAIGLAQGLALYGLIEAADYKVWPALDGRLFAPLWMAAWFTPLIVVQGLGKIRPLTLGIWAIIATLLMAGLALHDIFRQSAYGETFFDGDPAGRQLGPSIALMAAMMVILFIGQFFVAAADADRRPIARYGAYFDAASRLALQFILAGLFVGALWIVLWLGAGLFKLIDIDAFEDLITELWFAVPATATAYAAALHATDVRAGLVRGIRTIGLTLLSWLLPVMTVIAVLFLASLPFTGLEPLWQTRFATSLLLTSAAALVILINAAYQNGEGARALPIRIAGSVASLALTPLVALAGYALSLRVLQYGWTEERVVAASCVGVAACFALGYLIALISSIMWLKRIEAVNVGAFVIIALVFIALFSPIADPARIAVESQVARLTSGKVAPDEFDFDYLRWKAGHYGRTALTELTKAQGENAADIRKRAQEALDATDRYREEAPQDFISRITVYPAGAALPETLVRQLATDSFKYSATNCAYERTSECDAFLIDLDHDGAEEVLITDALTSSSNWSTHVLRLDTLGTWSTVGTMRSNCIQALEALRAGMFRTVPPAAPQWQDLEAGGIRVPFLLDAPAAPPGCPN